MKTVMKAVRFRDRQAASASLGEPKDLLGSWLNTHTQPQGLSRLDLTQASEFDLCMWGPGGEALERWKPEVTFYSGISSPEIIAFSARCDLDGYQGLLQGNLNLGLMVLAAYKTFPQGGGYFSREFFSRRQEGEAPTDSGGKDLFSSVEASAEVNPAAMIGRWRNTDENSLGISELAVEDSASGGLRVRALGSGESSMAAWGESRVDVYGTVDELGVKTFSVSASFDLGFMTSDLQIRMPGGCLAIADFTSFTDDSGRANYFSREFYYRA